MREWCGYALDAEHGSCGLEVGWVADLLGAHISTYISPYISLHVPFPYMSHFPTCPVSPQTRKDNAQRLRDLEELRFDERKKLDAVERELDELKRKTRAEVQDFKAAAEQKLKCVAPHEPHHEEGERMGRGWG